MKIKAYWILLLCAVIILCGCNTQSNFGINFYYPKQADYESTQENIGHEFLNIAPDPLAYTEILNNYLAGPKTKNLTNPFPGGTHLVSISLEQETATLILSDQIAELTGIDLTLACTCLSLTVKNMTGCAIVQIRAQNKLLDNQQSININTNTILLVDNVQ